MVLDPLRNGYARSVPPRSPILALFVAACGAAPAPVESPQPAPPVHTPETPAPVPEPPISTPPPALPTTPAMLTGTPLSRLRIADNMVVKLDHPLSPAALATHGVRSYQAFTATTPRVWLLVFEFASEASLRAATPEIVALVGADDSPPFYRQTSQTGAWLLVTGFPGEKPVSPEMEAARARFASQWTSEQ